MKYQFCTHCVMDSSDPAIEFDPEGWCNHCRAYDATVPQLPCFRGIASALSIKSIIGVSNSEQLSNSADVERRYRFDYDAFWETFLPRKVGGGFLEMSVPILQKPIPTVSTMHRRRARQRRLYREQVAASAQGAFARHFIG